MASKLATFRTDDEIWQDFQDKAKANGTNASALLQRFVRDYLDDKLDNRIDRTTAPDVDIDSKINEAVTSAIANLRASINDELVDIKQAIVAISCEATAPAKKPLMQLAREKVLAA